MVQKDKELLLKDLCARLPYGVICTDNYHGDSRIFNIDIEDESVYYTDFDKYGSIENCKPYLRTMSSMTEEEFEEWENYVIPTDIPNSEEGLKAAILLDDMDSAINWLNAHHFDYRDLIEKGLALEAPKGIY